jgi:transposase
MTPDEVVELKVTQCKHCNHILRDKKALKTIRRQEVEIPPLKIITTEYQAEVVECECCGKINKADFPERINAPVQYGPRINAMIVYLSQYQLIPYERLKEAMSDFFEIEISEGTIYNILERCYDNLESTENRIEEEIKKSPVVHFDETGAYCAGKRDWIHDASTEKATLYKYHSNRGCLAMNEIGILPGFNGIAVHDFYASYLKYDCRHALCNAHLLRELIFQEEEKKQSWALKMKDLLLEIKVTVESCESLHLVHNVISDFENKFDKIVKNALKSNPASIKSDKRRGKAAQTDTRNLLVRLRDYRKEYLGFMYNFSIPFDNNQAERDFRMVKVQQKISGCFRSSHGAEMFCRIRSVISTIRKNSMSVIEKIRLSFVENSNFQVFAT